MASAITQLTVKQAYKEKAAKDEQKIKINNSNNLQTLVTRQLKIL